MEISKDLMKSKHRLQSLYAIFLLQFGCQDAHHSQASTYDNIFAGSFSFASMLSNKLSFLLLAVFPAVAFAWQSNRILDSGFDCVYTVYVRTGMIWKGGTDSKVNLTLFDSSASGIAIRDLEQWGGVMGSEWSYFERGNLDIFSGRGPCLQSSPCKMVLGVDGSGDHPGWYCNYIEVTATSPHQACSQQKFKVNQWLGPDLIVPRLSVTVDVCLKDVDPSSIKIAYADKVM